MKEDPEWLFREPSLEGRHYDPAGYHNLRRQRRVALQVAFGGALSLLLVALAKNYLSLSSETTLAIYVLLIAIIVITIFMLIIRYNKRLEDHESQVISVKANQIPDLLADANRTLKEQSDALASLQLAKQKGDTIIFGNLAPVVINSNIKGSFNEITNWNPKLASALKTLGGYIENSANKRAAEQFEELHTQIASRNPNKTVVRALWEGIIAILPGVKQLTEVVKAIKDLLSERE